MMANSEVFRDLRLDCAGGESVFKHLFPELSLFRSMAAIC